MRQTVIDAFWSKCAKVVRTCKMRQQEGLRNRYEEQTQQCVFAASKPSLCDREMNEGSNTQIAEIT
jgi:hypothetical protein